MSHPQTERPNSSYAGPDGATLSDVAPPSPLKGLRKAQRVPLLITAERQGFRVFDYRLAQLFDCADIVSEGARKPGNSVSDPEQAYFGTTSIVLAPHPSGDVTSAVRPDLLLRLFAWDPHVRLRALRIACREAQVRANGVIDRVRTEIVVSRAPAGIRIHVDLEARVLLTFPEPVGSTWGLRRAVGSGGAPRLTKGVE